MFENKEIPPEGYASPFEKKSAALPVEGVLALPRVVLDPRTLITNTDEKEKP